MRRFYLIVVPLLASLLLVGFLAWQAHQAGRSHRQTAESVLSDYANLAAGQVVRRTLTEVGYYGYHPLSTALRAWAAENPTGAFVDPSALPIDDEQARARELARYLFRFDGESGTLELSDPGLGEAARSVLESELRATLAGGLATDGSYLTVFAPVSGEIRSWVITPVDLNVDAVRQVVGFEADLEVVGRWIGGAVERAPLLPPSLTGEDFSNESVFLEVRVGADQILFRSGEPYEPWLGVERPFGDEYRGLLEEVVVRLALDPAVAPNLVIGGLPSSRLPLLLGVLAVVVALVLIAILQFGRERELIRLRSDFVSRVSHELRTPLTQIRMFAETLLLDRTRGPQERQRALEIIDRESRRLGHLVENVLQFSRSEHDSIQLAREPRRLAPLLAELVEEFNPLLDGSSSRVVTRIEADPSVAVDEDAIRQVVLNLLENAVKYGPAQQEVQLGTTLRDDTVRIWVDDEGPGIEPKDRERIWAPFQRVASEPGSVMTGTGIGLSVVRELVARHGGSTGVSEGDRGGARFFVDLPIYAGGLG